MHCILKKIIQFKKFMFEIEIKISMHKLLKFTQEDDKSL